MTRRAWVPYALLAAACLAVALLAWGLARARPPAGGGNGPAEAEGAEASDSSEEAAAEGLATNGAAEGLVAGSGAEAGTRVAEAAGRAQALALLGERAADGAAEAGVVWTEDRGLEAAVAALLETYQEDGTARLLTYGYLDLRGNAWGALVARPGQWVDVVVAQADENDASTMFAVTRMTGATTPKDGGS